MAFFVERYFEYKGKYRNFRYTRTSYPLVCYYCYNTWGWGLLFAYSFSKFIINRTELIDLHGVTHKLKCDVDLFGSIGHIILWIIISILTLGLGYIFYFYKVLNNFQ